MSQKGGNLARCDFCGKSEADAKILISSPENVHICDECTFTSVEILINAAENKKEFMKKMIDHIFDGMKEKVICINDVKKE